MADQVIKTGTTPALKHIFDIIQDIFDFIVLICQMTLEVFKAGVEKVVGKTPKDVSGEIVLITGSGHGIGRELTMQYVSQYSTVICVDINEKNNKETLKKAKALNRGVVHSYICDVTDREAVLNLATHIKRDIGPVSVLINNAGIMPTKPLEKQTPDDIRRTFEINVFAHFWTLEAFLPHMKEQNRGHIIALSSMCGVVGIPNLVPYCASKFAVRGLMEALYNEMHLGPYKNLIKFTVIYPYAVDTGLCESVHSRFPSMLAMLDAKYVAEKIIEAHRCELTNVALPPCMLHLNNWTRLLPHTAALHLFDYMNCGIESKS
ncbi:epidermal retinol dehydrogenase 2 [Musca domestica]|uniref:Short-chain dehydrogenase/reductase 3 n=1 Tax=Musca domestica TaxID=7370 RepID=A0A1I8MK29_MUSDO|nr:epidermal retinol dehydrogenase 2 [Musca domestica]